MKQQTYPFRKPCGEVVNVSFQQMMEAEFGVLTLEDGTQVIRARDLEDLHVPKLEHNRERTDSISDSLGFSKLALNDQLEHLKRTGLRGIEFKEDKSVPGFYQVHCSNQEAKLRYAASRGMYDRNSHNGGSATLTEADFEAARELVSRGRDIAASPTASG